MTTRATILSRAFAKIGIADYTYSVTPDERAEARGTLDAMMAEWEARGVLLGYIPSNGSDNDAVDMMTPELADSAIATNLAVRLAPQFGKMLGQGLSKEARQGYDLVACLTIETPTVRNASSSIRGAGQRYYRRYTY